MITQAKNKYNAPKYRLVVRFTNKDVRFFPEIPDQKFEIQETGELIVGEFLSGI